MLTGGFPHLSSNNEKKTAEFSFFLSSYITLIYIHIEARAGAGVALIGKDLGFFWTIGKRAEYIRVEKEEQYIVYGFFLYIFFGES